MDKRQYLPYLFLFLSTLSSLILCTAEECYREISVDKRDTGILTFPTVSQGKIDNCKWKLKTFPSVKQLIRLHVEDSNLEDTPNCTADSVHIYTEDVNDTAISLASWCGNATPTYQFYIKSLTIDFHTEINETTSTHRGFKLRYQIGGAVLCNSYLKANTTVQWFNSQNWPEPFPSFTKCWWQIAAEDDMVIVLALRETDYDYDSRLEKIKVYEGFDDWHGNLEVENFYAYGNESYPSFQQNLLVVFTSGYNEANRTGFIMQYWAEPRNQSNDYTFIILAVVIAVINICFEVCFCYIGCSRRKKRTPGNGPQPFTITPSVAMTDVDAPPASYLEFRYKVTEPTNGINLPVPADVFAGSNETFPNENSMGHQTDRSERLTVKL